MARNLEQLQQRYKRMPAPQRGGPGGPGGHRRPGSGGGKPKDTKKSILRLLDYARGYKWLFMIVLLCMLVNAVASLAGAYLLAPIIDKITMAVNPNTAGKMSRVQLVADNLIRSFAGLFREDVTVMVYVTAAILLLGVIYLVGAATAYLQNRLMLSISQGSVERIRNDLFRKLQGLPVRYFDGHPTGEIMSRFTNDIDNIDVMLSNAITSLVSGIVTLIGTFMFMILTNRWLTLVTVAFVPLIAKGGMVIGKQSAKYYASQQTALGSINGYIEETITGQKVIKAFNHEDICIGEFSLLNHDMREKQFKAQFWGGIMWPIMGNISQISYAVTVGVGGILMCTAGLTPGALTVFANYSRHFSMPVNAISPQMSTILAALAGAERVFDVMDRPPESPDPESALPSRALKGHVVMSGVTFGYTPDKTVLKNISLYAKPGQKIAFVGSTGAGKTTVTNLLNRFYDIEQGSITIDGIDIKNIRRKVLRENIAMVLQDTHLFSGTIMENIRYGRLDATDAEVMDAARIAHADNFIMQLEKGYETEIEGDGSNLSQGQRQLLNIARAAVSKAPILVLDEATSSVDTRTERLIEKGMDSLMKDRTTFVIAHRLSTVRNAHAIMVLEDGEIIERGTHEDLLDQKGRYYELHSGLKELD